jgi:hypothetical protein
MINRNSAGRQSSGESWILLCLRRLSKVHDSSDDFTYRSWALTFARFDAHVAMPRFLMVPFLLNLVTLWQSLSAVRRALRV